MNTMKLAHKIRRELKLEGHYHAQMKEALKLAWAITKGKTSYEELIGLTVKEEEEIAVAEESAGYEPQKELVDVMLEAGKQSDVSKLIEANKFKGYVYVPENNGVMVYHKHQQKLFPTLVQGIEANCRILSVIVNKSKMLHKMTKQGVELPLNNSTFIVPNSFVSKMEEFRADRDNTDNFEVIGTNL